MADSIILSDGTTDIQLVKDTATHDYQWKYGMRVGGRPPRPLWHIPDNSPPQIVRLVNDTQEISFGLQVYPSDDSWDTAINDLNTIKRWIDGDDQQAARYHTDGDVNKIYLRVQLDGMTNYTDWTILYGNVDDSISFYQDAALLNKRMLSVNITLTCEPVGNGASFTLRNDLASSPHWVEDSNSDGLADGWSLISTPTVVSDTTNYLTGGVSGRCTTTASGSEGVRTDTVTAASSSDVVAYVWTSLNVNGDNVTAFLFDGSGAVVQQKSFDYTTIAATADKTAVDSAGRTWYRIVLSGTLANANVFLRVSRENADSTQTTRFYIDNAYLHVGSTTAPDGWCSTSAIQNRYDPTASAEGRINYVDVWGIPGDVPATTTLTIDGSTATGTKNLTIVSRLTDGLADAVDVNHWVENGNMTWALSTGSDSSPSDATRSGGSYTRYTAASPAADGELSIFHSVGSDAYLDFYSIPHRVFLIARSSSASTTMSFQEFPGIVKVGGGTATFNAANTWELLDIGYTIPIDRATYNNFGGSAVAGFVVNVTPGASSATTDIDAALIFPANSDGFIIVSNANSTTAKRLVGSERQVVYDSAFTAAPGFGGSLWTIPAGEKVSRYVFGLTNGSTQVHHLSDDFEVSFTIYPRTRHLLGTS